MPKSLVPTLKWELFTNIIYETRIIYYKPTKVITLALASLDDSASAAIARCNIGGNRTSFTSTRSTFTPHGSVAVSNICWMFLLMDSRSKSNSLKFFVPNSLRSVVWARSLVDRWASSTLQTDWTGLFILK